MIVACPLSLAIPTAELLVGLVVLLSVYRSGRIRRAHARATPSEFRYAGRALRVAMMFAGWAWMGWTWGLHEHRYLLDAYLGAGASDLWWIFGLGSVFLPAINRKILGDTPAEHGPGYLFLVLSAILGSVVAFQALVSAAQAAQPFI